ncbi:MAG: hypothetical protein HY437_00790 [Candidatus Magasanikbacteria bacterium]|nr:hypothetical protein [Candidatus Magasanikbacteria bacterium]
MPSVFGVLTVITAVLLFVGMIFGELNMNIHEIIILIAVLAPIGLIEYIIYSWKAVQLAKYKK